MGIVATQGHLPVAGATVMGPTVVTRGTVVTGGVGVVGGTSVVTTGVAAPNNNVVVVGGGESHIRAPFNLHHSLALISGPGIRTQHTYRASTCAIL